MPLGFIELAILIGGVLIAGSVLIGKLMLRWRARHLSQQVQFTDDELAQVRRNYDGKKLLCLVNPFGGNGFGTLVFDRLVSPTLHRLGVDFTLLRTERSRHAYDFVADCPAPFPYAAILVVGGDGLVHETVNGVMQRGGGEADFVPIAHLPAGTGNGIAVSLAGSAEPHVALKRVLLADPAGRPVDLIEVRQRADASHVEYSAMSFNFGLVGDADNVLENKSRWLGWLRDVVVPLWFIAKATMYRGRIEFTPAPCHDSDTELGRALSSVRDLPRSESGQCVIEGNIHFLIGSSLTHIAHDVHCTPLAQHDDGCLDAIVLQTNSRLTDLSFFADASNGMNVAKFKRAGGMYFKMLEATVTPIDPPAGSSHIVISTDGEVLPTLATHVKMLKARARFIF